MGFRRVFHEKSICRVCNAGEKFCLLSAVIRTSPFDNICMRNFHFEICMFLAFSRMQFEFFTVLFVSVKACLIFVL